MIFAYPLVTSINMTSGIDPLFCYVNDVTGGIFFPMILFAFWIIIVLGSYFMQRSSVGTGDFAQSMAVGSFLTTVVAILLRFVQTGGRSCLVDGYTLVVTIVVMIISVLFFLFSRD